MTNDMREALVEARNYIAADRDRLLNDFCTLTPERTPDRASMEDNERAIVAEADQTLASIDAALSAPTVPDGWVLAPVEPTRAMNNAGSYCQLSENGLADEIYAAMLAARPQPPASPAASDRTIDLAIRALDLGIEDRSALETVEMNVGDLAVIKGLLLAYSDVPVSETTTEAVSALEPAPAQGRDEPVAQYRWRYKDFAGHWSEWSGWFDGTPPEPDPPSETETRVLYQHPSDAYAKGWEDAREAMKAKAAEAGFLSIEEIDAIRALTKEGGR